MNKIYLNEQLKSYYSTCLKEEISFGNINPEIQKPLLLINSSKNIRSIFSKKGKHDIRNFRHSYLRISFTSKVEQTLLNHIIPKFEVDYIFNGKHECKCKIKEPYLQDKKEITKENNGSKWLIDSKYFYVSQIKFDLKKGDSKLHDKFWVELSECLSKL